MPARKKYYRKDQGYFPNERTGSGKIVLKWTTNGQPKLQWETRPDLKKAGPFSVGWMRQGPALRKSDWAIARYELRRFGLTVDKEGKVVPLPEGNGILLRGYGPNKNRRKKKSLNSAGAVNK
jgi:hypothetical protein